MGLDMYLTKSRRVEGLSIADYCEVNSNLPRVSSSEEPLIKIDLTDLEATKDLPGAKELNESVHLQGTSYQWWSIFHEVGYWRKANWIHNWFVENVQNGEDNCESHEVTKEKLEELRESCRTILDDHSKAEELLPTVGRFFFGSQEIDDDYYETLKETIVIIDKVLEDVNFDDTIVFYESSW